MVWIYIFLSVSDTVTMINTQITGISYIVFLFYERILTDLPMSWRKFLKSYILKFLSTLSTSVGRVTDDWLF